MHRSLASLVVVAFALFVLAAAPGRSDAYLAIFTGSQCTGTAANPQVTVAWDFYEHPPDQFPAEFVGYDVLRRGSIECGPFVRLNADIIPRAAGPFFPHRWLDATSVPGVAYDYRVIPVDANRVPVSIPSCDCYTEFWTSCPQPTTPVVQGTIVEDWGWALAVAPCPDSCYPSVYIDYGPMVEELRPFVGTGTMFRFYGEVSCGTVEGCVLTVDHGYEAAACGSTPSRPVSWGQIKASYR
jgi:hypothetical protein